MSHKFHLDLVILMAFHTNNELMQGMLDSLSNADLSDALADAQLLSVIYRNEQLRRVRIRRSESGKLAN